MDITLHSPNNTNVGRILGNPPLLSSPLLCFPLTLTRTDPHNLSLSLSLSLLRYPYRLFVAAAAATTSLGFFLWHPGISLLCYPLLSLPVLSSFSLLLDAKFTPHEDCLTRYALLGRLQQARWKRMLLKQAALHLLPPDLLQLSLESSFTSSSIL
ncbi:hypothetical protein TEA_021749 [Camellia sinensis var. sinensis]|uniref:Uncharacterized protein n=1 Tax=Camellia sinensis var. sinensis TaxID=542762 RepID=A0A4S4DKI9_CAMSN|nr:hypothetical protein TEA_021749 [Camellia sinensis var. sinensis]